MAVPAGLASVLVRHPRRTLAMMWARITGRRLRARQHRAALFGIDHRLALPARILARFPVESVSVDHPDLLVLVGEKHALVAGVRDILTAAFADPGLHALTGDALVQARAGGVLPVLRSVFDPDLAMATDAIGPVLTLRRATASELGIDATTPPLDAALRIAERYGSAAIGHVPVVVSVQLGRPNDPRVPTPVRERGPVGDTCRISLEERSDIVRRHLDRIGQTGARLTRDPDGVVTVERPLPDPLPLVSVIVPTRDRLDLLRPCVESLRTRTDWPNLEILIADNGSRAPETLAYLRALEGQGVRIVACPGPFDFAGMNNVAAAQARGSLLAFVNNDVEAFEPGWLRRMVREALRPEIGAVGAKLLDGEGRIQHGGIVLGTGGLVTHAHRHFAGDAPGYGSRLRATHAVSGVTAACLVVEARKFHIVGGFDAESFAVDFNDVDLCLRLTQAGYRTLMVPGAVLHHREGASRTRSAEAQARHEREIAALRRRWGLRLSQDPHYHPGFDPDLSTHARLRAGFFDGSTGPVAVRRSGPSRSPT